jgi:hypothetical protein
LKTDIAWDHQSAINALQVYKKKKTRMTRGIPAEKQRKVIAKEKVRQRTGLAVDRLRTKGLKWEAKEKAIKCIGWA